MSDLESIRLSYFDPEPRYGEKIERRITITLDYVEEDSDLYPSARTLLTEDLRIDQLLKDAVKKGWLTHYDWDVKVYE